MMDDTEPFAVRLSRRVALARIGTASAAILALCPSPVWSGSQAEAVGASGDSGSDDALLSRIVSAREPFIARRERPYRITRTLEVPAGRTVLIEPGTRIVWGGPLGNANMRMGVFEAVGDDVTLAVAGGEAFVECDAPAPFLYAAVMRGRRGFSVTNIRARNCQHVYVGAASTAYAEVHTRGDAANIARDVRVSGGGARFDSPSKEGHGACLLTYVTGVHVSDVDYENVANGVQWWGGDSGLLDWQEGARANERKCSDLLIERASVRHAISGIWGSMGSDVLVRDSRVEECADVGFDAEGCDAVTFERCTAHNGHNGCFTAFFLNDGIRFVDCRGSVDDKNFPLFRVYNVTQSNADNRNVSVEGGVFECLDPSGPSTMDCASGPVRELSIAAATLRNVRIDTAFLNMHRTRIENNELTFPHPLPSVAAIRAGGSQSLPGAPGGAIVANNRILYTANSSAGEPVAIEIVENDYNAAASCRVSGNVVSGAFATGIAIVSASGNPGIAPAFEIAGNEFDDLLPAAPVLRIERAGASGAPAVRWGAGQTRNGAALDLTKAVARSRPG
jgi:hypothetical protein